MLKLQSGSGREDEVQSKGVIQQGREGEHLAARGEDGGEGVDKNCFAGCVTGRNLGQRSDVD